MTLQRRIRLYIIGILLGTVTTVAIFGEKMSLFASWFPQNRVKMSIYEGNWLNSDAEVNQLKTCLGIDTGDVRLQLVNELDVDFDKSSVTQSIKMYQLYHGENKKPLLVEIEQDSLIRFVQLDKLCSPQ